MGRMLGLLLLAALGTACLGTLTDDPRARAITLAPRDVLDLPLRDSSLHWLLRGQPGWCGAHEARFGGNSDDPAVLTVRAIRFASPRAAERGLARITPGFLSRVLRDRMNGPPTPIAYPLPLPGDQAAALEYGVRLPPDVAPYFDLRGQLTLVRAGRVVLVVESIGPPPEQLVPAIDAMVAAAARLATGAC